MLDPYPTKALLTAQEVQNMLSMERTQFRTFLAETPSFPKPIVMGTPGKRKGDRRRWRKHEILIWIIAQPAETGGK